MEALLRANRFFGVSLLLLQQTEASFLAAFILAGSTVVTFKLFTHEWLRNPARVAAAQEAHRLAGRASAAASAGRAENLDIRSDRTGRGDGMGMNIAGGAAEVQSQALEYHVTPAEVAQAARGTAGYFSTVVSEGRAENLDIRSDRTGRGDGMGMNIATGTAEVQAQAVEYHVTPAEVAQTARGTAAYFSGITTVVQNAPAAIAAAALLSHGKPNAKKGLLKHPDAVRLGEEIGLSVMGQVAWERYTSTSAVAMLKSAKPLADKVSKRVAAERPSRAG